MLVGPKTFVPITWISKKQTAVSHSSTEAELISLDAGMRTEALPILSFWDTICQVFHQDRLPAGTGPQVPPKGQSLGELLEKYIDWIPPSLPPHSKLAKLKICEDNDAVLSFLSNNEIHDYVTLFVLTESMLTSYLKLFMMTTVYQQDTSIQRYK